jgi:uncharacterized membrane protein
VRAQFLSTMFMASMVPACVFCAQAATQNPAPKAPSKTAPPAVATGPAVPAPTSKHYPILVIAHGNEPFWSLRLGMKGPERLDRVNYPPILLEPTEITREESGNSWIYRAKDSATGAEVAIKLTREPCSDSMSDTKYTFTAEVQHAQIGTLKGCGQSAPDKFPEFRKKNQIDITDNPEPEDKDKKTPLDPIINFKAPVAVAYLDSVGRVCVSRGEVRKTVAPAGSELALSHDGKKLLYTRADSQTGPERTIVLYDLDTGRSKDLVTGLVRQAFWSPEDSRVAFMKNEGQKWQVWTFPANAPEKASALSEQNVEALQGWVSSNSVLGTDAENAYWIGADGQATQAVPLKDIYGDTFQMGGGQTIRVHPLNPDLLLVSAAYKNPPAGVPIDSLGVSSTFFLYEVSSKRRVVLGPADAWARSAEWSRDGLQIYFSRLGPGKTFATYRIFWDGSGIRSYNTSSGLVIGK